MDTGNILNSSFRYCKAPVIHCTFLYSVLSNVLSNNFIDLLTILAKALNFGFARSATIGLVAATVGLSVQISTVHSDYLVSSNVIMSRAK